MTFDTYCLVPDGLLSPAALEALFVFEQVLFHWQDEHIPVTCGSTALALFQSKMGDGAAHVRFTVARVPDTVGGWLYKLDDGSPVVGLSGDERVPTETFSRALLQLFPGGLCYTPGEGPPPATAAEFAELSKDQSHGAFL